MNFHPADFVANRTRFLQLMPENSVALLSATEPIIRNGDSEYPFVQDSNFYYLTGFTTRSAKLVLHKKSQDSREFLFIEQTSAEQAHWFGALPGIEETIQQTGISKCLPLSQFEAYLSRLLKTTDILITDCQADQFNFNFMTRQQQFISKIRKHLPYLKIINSFHFFAQLRQIKHPWEIQFLRKAIQNTHAGIDSLIRNCKPGMFEYELEAYFNFELKRRNSDPAFESIIASGKNATVLHYNTNQSQITDGDLVLIDLGSDASHYSADISRTFPANGKFSQIQKDLYQIVLTANKKTIDYIKPGLTFDDLNQVTRAVLADGLLRSNIITEPKGIEKYFTHGVSHQLGLDTHDISQPPPIVLQKGMVLTVEPGLYIPELKLGIRIEDDVLVTESGAENLSIEIPKEADEIERLMNH